jgi:DNA-binding transcriptional LysR family regulator
MPITIRQLDIFYKVAISGHVTKASEQLLLSQSAVSMSIAELEKYSGAPLFERCGRSLCLNDRGRAILPEVKEVLRRIALIDNYLTESSGIPIGALNVGASTTIGNYLLPFIVAEFSRRHPRAKAKLHVSNTKHIEDAVEIGDYDIGLIEGPSHHSSLEAAFWRDDELVIVTGCRHPWANERTVPLEHLQRGSWIMREEGSGTREVFEAAMGLHGLKSNVTMELGHTEAIKKAVESGLGVSCLSRMSIQRELEHGWLVEIQSELDLKRKLSILTRKGQYQTKLLRSFISLLDEKK